MKKVSLLLLLCLLHSILFAQTSKWFFTASSGFSVGGPSASLKSKMNKSGWNDNSDNLVLVFAWADDYPIVTQNPHLLLSFGKKIKENKSAFFTVGLAQNGKVEGFKSEGYSGFLLFGGNYGRYISVDYKAWQLTGGYQYSFAGKKLKLGFGPSLLLLASKTTVDNNAEKHNGLVPGAAGNFRFPLGRGRRSIGVEFFSQANLALPVHMPDFTTEKSNQEKIAVNMCDFMVGCSLAFRK